jgi:hypothetical protein
MEKFNEFRRRISPELSDEIMRLYARDIFGLEGDLQEESEEEETQEKAIVEEYNRTHPGFTVEKALWAVDQQIQLWEDCAIKMGECLSAIKAHETWEGYQKALGRIEGRKKISGELADAYIQAYREDLKNG